MFNPNDPHGAADRAPIPCFAARPASTNRALLICGIAFMLLQTPFNAAATLATTGDPPPEPPVVRPAQAAQPAQASLPTGGYQVRCWQHGRLLFEESHVTLPTNDSRFTLKLAGKDRNGRPIYVADTNNATCLVRYATEVFNPALPR